MGFEDNDVMNLVIQFYHNLDCSIGGLFVPFDSASMFSPIEDSDMERLGRDLSLEETKEAIFSMENYKSTGPNGFHPIFFKSQ